MTTLVLHIGHPKTGSTALQHALSSTADVLMGHSVLYPTQAEPRSEKHALATPYLTGFEYQALRRRTGLEGEALRMLSADYWDSVVSEVRAVNPECLILSNEGFWLVPRNRLRAFREKLDEVCDSVTVCAYLRSPAARFLSQMNQDVRMFREIAPPAPDYYRTVIEAWQSAGFERCSWRVYSSARLIDGDIVADFCAEYLPPAVSARDLPRHPGANQSVSSEALAVLQRLQRDRPGQGARDPERARIVALVRAADTAAGGQRRPKLKPEIEASLVAGCTDLHWLREHCGINFDDVDMARAASGATVDLAGLSHVEDFCLIDQERAETLQTRVMQALLTKSYRG
ncbi:MAG: hypothetical protein HKO62_11760 [Gammaproteobacteria bacterium]|nr:hypothetical protein [Gammaproteobacteria bacterium]